MVNPKKSIVRAFVRDFKIMAARKGQRGRCCLWVSSLPSPRTFSMVVSQPETRRRGFGILIELRPEAVGMIEIDAQASHGPIESDLPIGQITLMVNPPPLPV